jgi:hypothetical protein
MASRLLGSVVLAALLSAPALAQSQQPSAAPSPSPAPSVPSALPSSAPIRTLQYTVSVTVSQTREMPGTGNARTLTAGGYEAKGTIAVDVLAATLDGGLLVDTTENASGRGVPRTIVSIGGDGRLSYDPKQSALSDEDAALLRWLARTFYANRSTDPGTTWAVDLSSGQLKGIERYRVISNSDGKVSLEYRLEANSNNAPTPYSLSRIGSVVYDTRLTVPLQVSYRGDQRDRSGATTTTSVAISLTSDSFSR